MNDQRANETGPRSCVFCGSQEKLTREHVLPRWVYKALGMTGPVAYRLENQKTGDRIGRTGRGLDVTLRSVCRACNNGWLHNLETEFRNGAGRALPGRVITLSARDQVVAAAWGMKTWLLTELVQWRGRRPALTSAPALRFLREWGMPPASFQVWLGALDQPQLLWHTSHPIPPEPPYIGGLGILSVGCLVFHIYAPMAATAEDMPDLRLAPDRGFGDFFVPIWPLESDEVKWPPPAVFSAEDLNRLWPRGTTVRRPGA